MEKSRKKNPEVLQVSPVPLYTQIKGILRDRILDGPYHPHERIPPEGQ